jgi:hypothetical protein
MTDELADQHSTSNDTTSATSTAIRVTRLARGGACAHCRGYKQKCDGEMPCGRCIEMKLSAAYSHSGRCECCAIVRAQHESSTAALLQQAEAGAAAAAVPSIPAPAPAPASAPTTEHDCLLPPADVPTDDEETQNADPNFMLPDLGVPVPGKHDSQTHPLLDPRTTPLNEHIQYGDADFALILPYLKVCVIYDRRTAFTNQRNASMENRIPEFHFANDTDEIVEGKTARQIFEEFTSAMIVVSGVTFTLSIVTFHLFFNGRLQLNHDEHHCQNRREKRIPSSLVY